MASKRGTTKGTGAASADNEIDELFSGIGDKNTQSPAAGKTPVSAKPKPGDDILAELESELGEKPKAPSRPHTPRVAVGAATKAPAARASLDEPKSTTSTTAANLPRKSVESARGAHAASFTPSATSSELQESERTKGTVEQQQQQQEQQAPAAGGGWWGGILSTATAAMKQAEAAVKEIQQNEEAKKYLESVRGNVGALRGLGKSHNIHNVFNQHGLHAACKGNVCIENYPRVPHQSEDERLPASTTNCATMRGCTGQHGSLRTTEGASNGQLLLPARNVEKPLDAMPSHASERSGPQMHSFATDVPRH